MARLATDRFGWLRDRVDRLRSRADGAYWAARARWFPHLERPDRLARRVANTIDELRLRALLGETLRELRMFAGEFRLQRIVVSYSGTPIDDTELAKLDRDLATASDVGPAPLHEDLPVSTGAIVVVTGAASRRASERVFVLSHATFVRASREILSLFAGPADRRSVFLARADLAAARVMADAIALGFDTICELASSPDDDPETAAFLTRNVGATPTDLRCFGRAPISRSRP